jgi:4-amino-4-deoxy-L-arabinose transferase-like glycosyltransferase
VSRRAEQWVALAVFVLAAVLLFSRLGSEALWNDEAQTAVLSKSMLVHHVPLGHDGQNSLSGEWGAEFGPDDVYRWSPWLPLAMVAASFKLFGLTTFAARLPFALAALATVVVCFFFAKEQWGARVGLLSSALLALSVPFLLLSRQSRYYALTTLFSLICLREYALIARGARRTPWALVAALSLLFYSQNVYAGVVGVTIAAHLVVFRNGPRQLVVAAFALFTLLALPWVLFASGMHYRTLYPGMLTLGQLVRFVPRYLVRAGEYFNYWALAALAVAAVALAKLRRERLTVSNGQGLALLGLFTLTTLLLLSLVSVAPFFRYLAPLCPIAAITTALLLDRLFDWDLRAGLFALTALIASSKLPQFIYEISHDFQGPIDGIVRFLEAHAARSDVVAITYGDLSTKFYTGLRVVGGLTGEDLSPAKGAKWVIIRKHVVCSKDETVRSYLLANVDWSRYQRITLASPDTTFENREDPEEHLFRTATGESPVVIYERTH